MLGLPRGEVFLLEWTPEWHEQFIAEEGYIREKLGKYVVHIHHIGSTAVKHLSAKPILDIAIEISDFNDGEATAPLLKELGYAYRGTNILPDRHYFTKGEPRTHQIHMFECGNRYLKEQLKFRDYLREHAETRRAYEQLKRQLSQANKSNKHKYTDEKTAFITAILKKL